MVSLTVYGGVNEIGGNKVLLEDSGTRIFLDFGKSFGMWGKYFEEYLRPTSSRGIETFWKTGLLPDIEGIYRPDLLEFAGAKVHKETSVDAVLLSHAHFDHAAYVSFLDNEIDVYCTPTTKKVMEVVQEVGQRNIESEMSNFKERPLLRKDYKKPPTIRKIHGMERKFKVGGLEVEPVMVDHSIPGACAFILHCSGGPIVYSGDMRLHGSLGHKTWEFAQKASECKPEAFICEGTRIDSTAVHSEQHVMDNSSQVIGKAKNLVFADFSWKDTTRFMTFFEIAKKNDRKLLLPFRSAHYIRKMKEVIPELPDLDDGNILLYQEKCGSGTYDESDYTGQWAKPLLTSENTVKADYVHAHQKEIIACLGYFDMLDITDIDPDLGSAYIHSTSEAFNEEMEFDARRCDNWLGLLGLPRHQVHASGHAPQQDLLKIIAEVSAKKVVPIHTEFPKKFAELGVKCEFAREKEPMKI